MLTSGLHIFRKGDYIWDNLKPIIKNKQQTTFKSMETRKPELKKPTTKKIKNVELLLAMKQKDIKVHNKKYDFTFPFTFISFILFIFYFDNVFFYCLWTSFGVF